MDLRLLPLKGVRSLIAMLRRDKFHMVSPSRASGREKEGFTGSAVLEEPFGPVALTGKADHVSS